MFSPTQSSNIFEDDILFEDFEDENYIEKQLKCFDCLGNVIIKDNKNDFSLNGFLKLNEIKYLFLKDNEIPNRNQSSSTVELFGRVYDRTFAALENSHVFFNLTRKKLLYLDSATKTNSRTLTGTFSIPTSNDDLNYFEIRKQIDEWILFLRNYIMSIVLDEANYDCIDSMMEILSPKLHSLRLLLGKLINLPDYVLHHSASSSGNKSQLASYHLFHLHLELRWLHLTITYLLQESVSLRKLVAFESQMEEPEFIIAQQMPIVEKYLKHLIEELINVAIARFDKINLNEIHKKSFFNCTCIKELWILILLFIDKLHSDKKLQPFWTYINEVVDLILNTTSNRNILNSQQEASQCGELNLPTNYKCSNPSIFVLWCLSHLAQLFAYDDDGSVIESQFAQMNSNWQILDRVLKQIASQDTQELQMRASLHLLLDIVQLWPSRCEPVTILWEYYHKKLNSTFMLQGAPLNAMAVICNSGYALLNQVRDYLNSDVYLDNATSFELFLRLVNFQLKGRLYGNEISDSRLWQQIRGRIYIKLSTSKIASLRELGLYHIVSLFLTLSLSLELNEISKKLHELLAMVPFTQMDAARRRIAWLAQVALILNHSTRSTTLEDEEEDLSWLTKPLVEQASQLTSPSSSTTSTSETSSLMRILIDGLRDVVENSPPNSPQMEHLLIGVWIPQYLSNASLTEQCRILDTCLLTATRLTRTSSVLNEPLHDALINHILPYLRNTANTLNTPVSNRNAASVAPPPFQVADLAVALTLAELDRNRKGNFSEIFTEFTSYGVHGDVIVRYLTLLLIEDRVLKALNEHLPHYETIIIQAWLRCMVTLNLESGSTTSCRDLTQQIAQLPEVRALCHLHATPLDTPDPVDTWIQLLGRHFTRVSDLGERIAFKERCNLYCSQLEKAITIVMKDPKVSADVVDRVYMAAAKLVFHCGQIIYAKANPKSLLLTLISHLLLPNAIYKPEFRLHAYVYNSVRRTYALFIKGFWRLDHSTDPFIMRTLRDLVICYLPRLTTLQTSSTTPCSLGASRLFAKQQQQQQAQKHPILSCLGDDNVPLSRFIYETIANNFLTIRSTVTHPQILVAISVLISALEVPSAAPLIAEICLERLFEIFILISNESARNIFQNILQLISDLKPRCRMENLTPIIATVIRKYLAFKSINVFRALQTLASREIELVRSTLPALRDEISCVERRRGAGIDQLLRSSLIRLENLLDKGKPSSTSTSIS